MLPEAQAGAAATWPGEDAADLLLAASRTPEAAGTIYDSESMRRFAGVELGDDVVPDEMTILRFWHLLEQHRLTEAIFGVVKERLTEQRLPLKAGAIVDAPIIAAPSSTKDAGQAREPEMN